MGSIEENEILPTRNVDKTVLGASTKVDPMLKKLTRNNITTWSKVVFYGEIITSVLLCVKNSKGKQKNNPMWKKKKQTNP